MDGIPETVAMDKHLGENSERVIGNATSAEEIIEELRKRGCPDLTSLINEESISRDEVAGGGFCNVFRGALKDGTEVAIRSIRVYEDGDQKKQKILKHAARELYYWSKLKHRNILPLRGLAFFRTQLSMISTWIPNGNLATFLQRYPNAHRPTYCMHICSGLLHIHNDGMVHGDLKAENVLVSREGVAMITDFGSVSLMKDPTLCFTATGKPGISLRWAAPELLEPGCMPSKETDVYAYGMTAYEVLTGEAPYQTARSNEGGRSKGRKPPPRPDGISTQLWNIFSPCWSNKPADRPTMDIVDDQLSAYESKSTGRKSKRRRLSEDTSKIFEKHGYIDVSRSLILTKCDADPSYQGESREIYHGILGDGGKVAINIILKGDHDTIESALEIQFGVLKSWLSCNHPNISQIRGFAEFLGQPAILFSWADHRSVRAYLALNPSANRCAMSAAICDALAYLHANDIVYAHLRGDTVLVVGEGVPMLAEPGADIFGPETTPQADKDLALTYARWTAPEVLKGKTEHTRASDVYALGMTILEIITGEIPFCELADEDIQSTVVDEKRIPQRPESHISESSAQGLILWANLKACWSSPAKRPTADELMHMASIGFLKSASTNIKTVIDENDQSG